MFCSAQALSARMCQVVAGPNTKVDNNDGDQE